MKLPPSGYATGRADVWLTGDAHLENTGADRGADNEEQFALTSSTIWDDSVRDVGRLLAAAHSRADQDIPGTGLSYSADAAIDNAMTSVSGLQAETRAFATSYADQVTADWQAYVTAKNSGRPLF